MNKRDFYLKACQEQAYRYKAWVFSVFSITQATTTANTPVAYEVRHTEHRVDYYDPVEQTWLPIEDGLPGVPLLVARDAITLEVGALPNVITPVETTYGNVLANAAMLVYPFGDKIPFVTGRFDIGAIEKDIARRLTGDNAKPRQGVKDPIYVHEYLNFIDAAMALCGFNQLWVPSATRKTMTRDPRIPELRAQLVEQYKDSLDDPATIAIIEAELKKVDREWMKGDRGEGFYHKPKAYNVVRKKMFLTQGAEMAFQEDSSKATFIEGSLSEGWDIEKLPEMNNNSREGSYNRGTLTALGGESAKTLIRMMQNTRITEEDCGTTLGITRTLTDANINQYLGFFYQHAGNPVEITEDNKDSLVGRQLTLRTPLYCKTARPNFCVCCMGRSNARNPNGVSALISAVGSKFMLIRMAKMHGTALETVVYDVNECLV